MAGEDIIKKKSGSPGLKRDLIQLKSRKNMDWSRQLKKFVDFKPKSEIELLIDQKLQNYVTRAQFYQFKDELTERTVEIEKLLLTSASNFGLEQRIN